MPLSHSLYKGVGENSVTFWPNPIFINDINCNKRCTDVIHLAPLIQLCK